MRFIDLGSSASCSGNGSAHRNGRRAARGEAEALEDVDARRKHIRGRRAVWTAFRPCFELVFGVKCWYTESENPGTDDDIDHFRPKGRIAGTSGTRWDIGGKRSIGGICVLAVTVPIDCGAIRKVAWRMGRETTFPLLVEENRWMAPDEFCLERPTLLDQRRILRIRRWSHSIQTDGWRFRLPT